MSENADLETDLEQVKCMRVDARLNDEKLLAAAREVFVERGAEASLEEIARRAGVGIGTLYRHFPTRQDLLEVVMTDSLQMLATTGRLLLDSLSPSDAFEVWLKKLAEHVTIYHGLTKSMAVVFDKHDPKAENSCSAMRDAGQSLLERCQYAGEIRNEVGIDEVLVMVNGLIWSTEQSSSTSFETLLAIMLDGLRTTR